MPLHIDIPKPHIDVPPPHVDIPKPHVDVPPPHIDIPKPHIDVPPPHIDVPPPHIDIPKPHIDVPPPHVDIPKPHIDVPPPHVDVPPLHVDVPPPHIDLPPPHIDIPPPHIDVPPVHIDVPPIDFPKLRRLSPQQIAAATNVYGASIDFSTVYLSDKTGLGGRAFVVGVPVLPPLQSLQIMNLGPEPVPLSWLIHELAHVWQSQHHPEATAFMINAVASQALEEAANKAAGVTTFSAYAYRPGKAFVEYAAEQIAQQVENGEAAIVAHVRSIPPRIVDPFNVVSLIVPRIENTASPGVKK